MPSRWNLLIFALGSWRNSTKTKSRPTLARVFLREAMEIVESSARNVLAACSEGDSLRTNLAVLKRFTKFEPVNAIAARRRIAERLLAAGRYLV